eukprot:gb/GFBE01003187.1/.p1 GENE.gb/GFBE01003187.1/~~gb/GFBE01003187.1/.p1  ORF type:complete len:259 (+),score=29.37 gb/GFBE01003187.1/:1-777(+)
MESVRSCVTCSLVRGSRLANIRCPRDEHALQDLLERYEVDTSLWGTGKAKPLVSLLRELREGSCCLRYDRTTRELCRCVEPVFVQLTYCGKVLVERAQVLPNGNRREANAVLAEKREPCDTNTLDAAIRGIREELHVDVSQFTEGLVHSLKEDVCYVERMDSSSYPGVRAMYQTTHVRLNILSGSLAERAFASCGLPACRAFETEEQKHEGTLQLFWEWVEFHEAMSSGVKGMQPPKDVPVFSSAVANIPSLADLAYV